MNLLTVNQILANESYVRDILQRYKIGNCISCTQALMARDKGSWLCSYCRDPSNEYAWALCYGCGHPLLTAHRLPGLRCLFEAGKFTTISIWVYNIALLIENGDLPLPPTGELR